MDHRLCRAALAIIAATVSWGVTQEIDRLPNAAVPISHSPFQCTTNLTSRNGVFRSDGGRDGAKIVSTAFALRPNTRYLVEFNAAVQNAGIRPEVVTIDFYRPDHDEPTEETKVSLKSGTIRATVYSGDAPPGSELRIFFFTPAHMELSDIRIGEWSRLGRIALGLAMGCSILFGFLSLVSLWLARDAIARVFLSSDAVALTLLFVAYSIARALLALMIENPLIASDELVYRTMSFGYFQAGTFYPPQAVGFSPDLPNFLYPWVISCSFFFGDHFFTAARVINALLMNLSLFPVYFLAREFMPPRRALLAAALTPLLPAFNATMFFMTEPVVYPVLLLAFYCTFKALTSQSLRWWIACGAALTLSMLAKPGSVMLIAAAAVVFAGTMLCELVSGNVRGGRRAALGMLAVTMAGVAAYLGISLLLKGDLSYKLGTYAIFTKNSPSAVQWPEVAMNAAAHVATMLFTWFIPVAVCVLAIPGSIRNRDGKRIIFLALAFALLGTYLASVLKLTSVMGWQEHFLRLHVRYYSMIFPIFLVGFLAFHDSVPWRKSIGAGSVALFALVGALDVFFFFPHYAVSGLMIVDNPDLAWYLNLRGLLPALALLSLLVVILYAARGRVTACPALALLVVLSIVSNVGELRQAVASDRINGTHIGSFPDLIRGAIPNRDATVAVVDAIRFNRYVIPFWLPYRYTAFLNAPAHELVRRDSIPAGTRYLIACDEYRFDFPVHEEVRDGAKVVYSIPVP